MLWGCSRAPCIERFISRPAKVPIKVGNYQRGDDSPNPLDLTLLMKSWQKLVDKAKPHTCWSLRQFNFEPSGSMSRSLQGANDLLRFQSVHRGRSFFTIIPRLTAASAGR